MLVTSVAEEAILTQESKRTTIKKLVGTDAKMTTGTNIDKGWEVERGQGDKWWMLTTKQ